MNQLFGPKKERKKKRTKEKTETREKGREGEKWRVTMCATLFAGVCVCVCACAGVGGELSKRLCFFFSCFFPAHRNTDRTKAKAGGVGKQGDSPLGYLAS